MKKTKRKWKPQNPKPHLPPQNPQPNNRIKTGFIKIIGPFLILTLLKN
jgi:hypothetical protein